MVELVLQDPGAPSVDLECHGHAVEVDARHPDGVRTTERKALAGEREAALRLLVRIGCARLQGTHPQLGVQDHPAPGMAVVVFVRVGEDAQRHADLRRGKAHARRSIHRLEHVRHERADLVGDGLDGGGGAVEDRIAHDADRKYGHVRQRNLRTPGYRRSVIAIDVGSVEDVGDQLVGAFQDPGILIGIPLALIGAVFMSFGAQYQHRGVTKVERLSGGAQKGLTAAQLGRLLARPSWVLGTVMLGLAIVCQLSALSFAPLIVVQPLGAIALVITTLLNAKISGHRPTRRSVIAIVACVGGIFLFVTIAALFATETPLSDRQLITVLLILAVVAVLFSAVWLWRRHHVGALFYIMAAGILYGFVATLAKVVLSRIESGDFEWLTLTCVAALLIVTAVGAYFVQSAYSSGPPDLVIAGLTVIDPIVAVVIGLTVLGEAQNAPLWAYIGFAVAGAIAVWGVFQLARHHPQIISDSQELPLERGSDGSGFDGPHPPTGSTRLGEAVAKVWPEPPINDPDDDAR